MVDFRAVDYEALNDAADRVHIGAEMRWLAGDNLTLAIRTGYVTGASQRGRPSVGMGVRWNLLDLGLELDYAYFRNEDAPHVDKYGHTVSISVRPRKIVDWFRREPAKPQIIRQTPVDTAKIVRDSLDTRFDEIFGRLSDHFIAGEIDSAIIAAYQTLPLATTPWRQQKAESALEVIRKARDEELVREATPPDPDQKPDDSSLVRQLQQRDAELAIHKLESKERFEELLAELDSLGREFDRYKVEADRIHEGLKASADTLVDKALDLAQDRQNDNYYRFALEITSLVLAIDSTIERAQVLDSTLRLRGGPDQMIAALGGIQLLLDDGRIVDAYDRFRTAMMQCVGMVELEATIKQMQAVRGQLIDLCE